MSYLQRLTFFFNDFKYYLLINLSVFLLGFCIIWLLYSKKKFAKYQNAILSFTSCVVFLVGLFTFFEIYFRYIYDLSDGIDYARVNHLWYKRHVILNGDFRRDQEFVIQKQSDEFRIGVIGDSVAFGLGIKNVQDRFSNILETKLKNDNLNAKVYNLGISGEDTKDELLDFKNKQYLDFDAVIWQYFLNDANTSTQSATANIIINAQKKLSWCLPCQKIVDHSVFADFLYWRLFSRLDNLPDQFVNQDLNAYHDPAVFASHQAIIKDFTTYLKTNNIPLIVIVFPFIHSEQIRLDSQDEYDKMISVFRIYNTETINLASKLSGYSPSQLKASPFDPHPNELVHQIATQLLYQSLKNQKIIP